MKVIIFDMDGVLFLSGPAHAAAFRKVLSDIGVDDFDYRQVAGMKTKEAFKSILRTKRIPFTQSQLKQWTERKQTLAYRALAKNPPIAKGCKPLLENLARRFRLALV